MEKLEFKEGTLYVRDNYLYKCDKSSNGTRYLACRREGCKVRFIDENGAVRQGRTNILVLMDDDKELIFQMRTKAEMKAMQTEHLLKPVNDVYNEASNCILI